MRFKRKKIELIYLGGLPFKKKNRNERGLKKWLKDLPELVLMTELKPKFFIFPKKSPTEASRWQVLARYIYGHYSRFDGFIVADYPEKILSPAIALSFMLPGIKKPVIFTGEANPQDLQKKAGLKDVLNDYETLSLKANIINSLQVMHGQMPGTAIMFGNKLIKAVRAAVNKDNINLFSSSGQLLGRVAFNINLNKIKAKAPQVRRQLMLKLNERVIYLKVYSGLTGQLLDDLLKVKDGIILDYANRHIDIDGLKDLETKDKLVVSYNCPTKQDGRNFIPINNNILPHVLIIKLMWALGQGKNIREARKLLLANRSGEFLNKSELK